jgi:glycosyltransferase involved in cell wall biosynthesis
LIVADARLYKSSNIGNLGNVAISMVMPAFNVGGNIAKSILQAKEALQRVTGQYEIIVVDDGSSDDTVAAIEILQDDRVKVLRNVVNHGKGFSIKKGIVNAVGEYIVMLDADAEIQPGELVTYIWQLKEHDMIISSKRNEHSSYDAPFSRKFLSAGYNKLVRIMTGLPMSDTQAGLKVFRREPLEKIIGLVSVKRYAFDTELLVLAMLLHFKVSEVPVVVVQRKRLRGADALRMLLDLLGISYRLHLTRWYQKNLAMAALTLSQEK